MKHLEPTAKETTLKRFVDAVLERNFELNNIPKAVPRFKYCKYSRKFLPLQDSAEDTRSLLPNSPAMKAFLYAHRYEMVYQRVLRNPVFASSSGSIAGTNRNTTGFKLQPIEFLLALGAKEDSVVVLGALTQLKNGQWYLEDPTSLVKLDLSVATFHQGLFPEGAIVLAEGSFDDDVFKVTGIGLPPVEEPHLTRRYFSVSNPFGGSTVDGPAAAVDTNMIRLLQTSQAASDMLVLLGETRLDMPGCIEHLETLFLGYSDFPPTAFVLCGDFIGPEFAAYNSLTNKSSVLKKLFRRLGEAYLRAYDDLARQGVRQPKLILVVGPNDPSLGPRGILPRPALPEDLFEEVPGYDRKANGRTRLPTWLHLASNPVRLRLYTREIVVFRYDYSRQLLRHCVHLPGTIAKTVTRSLNLDYQGDQPAPVDAEFAGEEEELSGPRAVSLPNSAAELGFSLARCLASQAHLTPLALHVSPVYWSWDQALSLNPLPNLVVAVEPNAVADLNVPVASSSAKDREAKATLLGNCLFSNPGRFGSVQQTAFVAGSVGTLATQDGEIDQQDRAALEEGEEEEVMVAAAKPGQARLEYTFKVYYPSTQTLEDSRLPS
ncbi:unnamed protein product [Schistocephalus solidus]|uniref:DNA polymerase II subunit 2 n=1 Tax=Schistocephalus solidus TaxID=70667 RepID=A0A3P7ETT1_SCHSO|nr:unnamed protein product [Schistocephalus solidus]